MKILFRVVCFFWLSSVISLGEPPVLQVLLNKTMVDQVGMTNEFINTFDLSPSNLFTLVAGNRLHLLGWGGLAPTANRMPGDISALAYTPDGVLFVISSNNLGIVDKAGDFKHVFKLPAPGMKITAGLDCLYLYEQNPVGTNSLYAYYKGRTYRKLVESPEPIQAVSETSNVLYYATGQAIFSFEKGKKLQLLLGVIGKEGIESLAVNTKTGALYFSTGNGVYLVKGDTVKTITRQVGGLLHYRNGTLFIFNAKSNLLIGFFRSPPD